MDEKQVNEKGSSKKIYNGVRENFIKGKLASTVTYKDSLKNGPAKNYYPSGKINMVFNYKNNVKNGAYKWYFENGKIYLEGDYKDGEKDGVFKMYRENGKLKSEMPWYRGKPCVGLKEYFASGKLKPTPKLTARQINTIKLDNRLKIELKLSENSKYADFYEGYLGENESFSDIFVELDKKNGKAYRVIFLEKGGFMMKRMTFIATFETKDKNFYILKKYVNVSADNRR